jgi:hypothetical protein
LQNRHGLFVCSPACSSGVTLFGFRVQLDRD